MGHQFKNRLCSETLDIRGNKKKQQVKQKKKKKPWNIKK